MYELIFGSFPKVVKGNSASPVVRAFFQEVVTSENDHLPHEVSHLKHCWLDGSEQHFENVGGPKFRLNSVLVWEWGIFPFLILCQCSAEYDDEPTDLDYAIYGHCPLGCPLVPLGQIGFAFSFYSGITVDYSIYRGFSSSDSGYLWFFYVALSVPLHVGLRKTGRKNTKMWRIVTNHKIQKGLLGDTRWWQKHTSTTTFCSRILETAIGIPPTPRGEPLMLD